MTTIADEFVDAPLSNEAVSEFTELVSNAMSMRKEFIDRMTDPRRDVYKECGYPSTGATDAWFFQLLFDREPVANRVVEVLPKETWQVSPEVFEDKDGEVATPFEQAWDGLGQSLRGEKSYYQDEQGSTVWEYLLRVDILSGIGSYGVILLGVDDGLPLNQPVEGVIEENSLSTTQGDGDSVAEGTGDGRYDPAGLQGAYKLTSNAIRKLAKAPPKANGKPKPGAPKPPPPPAAGAKPSVPTSPADGTKPAEKEGAETPDQPVETERKLLYLRVFPEAQAQVTSWEQNRNSPRYGQPTGYLLTYNNSKDGRSGTGAPLSSVNVHWTRIIHVADNRESDEALGVPRMRPVLNNILGIQKIDCASPEAFWKGCLNLLSLETHPQMGGDVAINRPGLERMMRKVHEGFQRYMVLMGMSAKSIAPTITDPTPHSENQIEKICIKIGVPVRVFKGSERGELASTQDDDAWNDRLKARQKIYVTPRVIVPFVDRLIMIGVLPEPEGFSVEWPDITSENKMQKMEAAEKLVTLLGAYVSGNVASVYPETELFTRDLGMDQETAMLILEQASANAEEKVQTEIDQTAKKIEAGVEPDPQAVPPTDEEGPGKKAFGANANDLLTNEEEDDLFAVDDIDDTGSELSDLLLELEGPYGLPGEGDDSGANDTTAPVVEVAPAFNAADYGGEVTE